MAWVLGTLVLAAVISPWIYQGGHWLSAMADAKELPKVLAWLGDACGRADVGRFFDRSLLFSALLLLPLLLHRVRKLRVPCEADASTLVRRFCWKSAAVQIVTGCVIAGGLLWGVGALLEWLGAFTPRHKAPAIGKLLPGILAAAAVVALLEEWLFRGVLLGMWLRSSRPRSACVGISLLFAFLHFLKPPDGRAVADPGAASAGFELLGNILLHFTNPLFLVTDFATLFGIGLILAWARVRTGALWFSIGLHAGWILSFKMFQLLHQNVPGNPLSPWGVGENLRSGLLPLLTLGVTAVICHFVLRHLQQRGADSDAVGRGKN